MPRLFGGLGSLTHARTRRMRVVALWLLCVSVFVRLPFFFPAVIDSDESTYILMGQSIVDGHLPYEQTLDMKPPLAYVPYAGAILLFGRRVPGVRLVGACCVFLTAFLVYLLSRRLWSEGAAMVAAVASILAISLLTSGQATLTEHIALPLLLGALYVLTSTAPSYRRIAVVGALMSAATLVRQNMGLAVLIVGADLLINSAWPGATRLKQVGAYCAGGVMVVVAVGLPYALGDRLWLLWTVTVLAPLYYSSGQNSLAENFRTHVLASVTDGPPINIMLWMTACAGLTAIIVRSRGHSTDDRRRVGLVVATGLVTMFGILISGPAYPHYLIQLVPFAAMYTAGLVHYMPRRPAQLLVGAGLVVSLASLAPLAREYGGMIHRASVGEPLSYGVAYGTAAYLTRENVEHRPVYLLIDHLAYWLTGSYPPTRLATHPSAIGKEYVITLADATSLSALDEVFARRPAFVVRTDAEPFANPGASQQLKTILSRDYVLAERINDRSFYKRITP